MTELLQVMNAILTNPETAWVGYSLLILVALTVALTIVSGLLVKLVNNIREISKNINFKKATDYKKQIKNEVDVSTILRSLRHDLHADRVCVLQYHNGVHSIADNSLLKVSMSHESLSLNVSSVMNEVQNWFANSLGDINSDIFDGKYIAHYNINEIATQPELRSIYQYLMQKGVKSFYCFPVTDVYGRTFGIGVVQYIRKHHTMDGEWIRWTRDRFVAIGTLLAGTQDKEVEGK